LEPGVVYAIILVGLPIFGHLAVIGFVAWILLTHLHIIAMFAAFGLVVVSAVVTLFFSIG
jgi:hypothetical protein